MFADTASYRSGEFRLGLPPSVLLLIISRILDLVTTGVTPKMPLGLRVLINHFLMSPDPLDFLRAARRSVQVTLELAFHQVVELDHSRILDFLTTCVTPRMPLVIRVLITLC